MYHQSLARTLPNTSPLYCYRFIAASSRPPSTLPSRYQSRLQSQLKRCQDQSLVYRRFIVNASRPRSLSVIHSISVHCQATVTLSLLSTMSPVHLQCLARACWAYPQFTTSVFSSTMSARLSSRQYVTDSSLKPPLVPGILSNLAKTLSEHCQSTVRALPGSHPHQVMYRQVVLSVSSKVILGASSNRLRGTPLPFSSLVTVSSSLFHLVPFVMMSHNLPPNAFKSPFKPLLKLRAFLLLVQRSFRSL